MARQLAREEGLLVGTSSGLNIAAAVQLARELGPGKTVATVAVDTGFEGPGRRPVRGLANFPRNILSAQPGIRVVRVVRGPLSVRVSGNVFVISGARHPRPTFLSELATILSREMKRFLGYKS